MNTRIFCCLAVGLFLSACGVHADSERSVLPQFRTERLKTGTVLFAPTFERSLSDPKSLSLEFGVPVALHEQPAALRAAAQGVLVAVVTPEIPIAEALAGRSIGAASG